MGRGHTPRTGTPDADGDPPVRCPQVLLAEDDTEVRRLLTQALERDGYDVIAVSNGATLLRLLDLARSPLSRSELPDLIISDVRMPEVGGLEVLAKLQQIGNAPPVILITAFGDTETHALARRMGAAGVFDKPFDIDDLLTVVMNVTRHERRSSNGHWTAARSLFSTFEPKN